MAIVLKKATRGAQPIRMAVQGRTGAGKTYSSLQWAQILGGERGATCLIDTERNAAANYSPALGEDADPETGKFDFFHYDWRTEHALLVENRELGAKKDLLFDPKILVQVIKDIGSQVDTLIIDSASHFWEGDGGVMDQVSAHQRKNPKDGQLAWNKIATPLLTGIYNAILDAPCNIIFCMRSKLAFDRNGSIDKTAKTNDTVKIVGTAPVFKADVLYEMGVAVEIDAVTHGITILKTRFDAVGDVGESFTLEESARYIKDLGLYIGTDAGVKDSQAAVEALAETLADDGTDDNPREPVKLEKKADSQTTTKSDAATEAQITAVTDLFKQIEDEDLCKAAKKSFVKELGGTPAKVINADNLNDWTLKAQELVDSALGTVKEDASV